MRLQGKITNWNDDKGFGFTISQDNAHKAFVHIKAFTNHRTRPVDGDLITYELSKDDKGRYFAKDIRFAKRVKQRTTFPRTISFGTMFVIVFSILLILATVVRHMPLTFIGLYLIASIVTYVTYAIDKSAAQNGKRRTPENTLHLLAFVGGWPGAMLAQKKLHHKSTKKAFLAGFWVTVIANCSGLFWMLTTKAGSDFISSIARIIP